MPSFPLGMPMMPGMVYPPQPGAMPFFNPQYMASGVPSYFMMPPLQMPAQGPAGPANTGPAPAGVAIAPQSTEKNSHQPDSK